MECKEETNKKRCNCTFSCERKYICCDCLHYHRKLGELPACYFPAQVEKTGERSIEAYLDARS